MMIAALATAQVTSTEEIDQLLAAQNPFDRHLFVKQQDIWERSFLDVPSLNAHASDAVFQAIKQIKIGQRATSGITLIAEKGLGKSHIISRIRHRLQAEGSAFFIYMNEFSNLDRLQEEFLQALAYSLKQEGSQGAMQWQELATALINRAFSKDFYPKQLIEKFLPNQLQDCLRIGKKPSAFIQNLSSKILKSNPALQNQDLIQAILWTLSPPHATTAINWIAGKGIPPVHAEEMELPIFNDEMSEADEFELSRQILNIAGEYQTVVICFDELDKVGREEDSTLKPLAVASFAKDVLDSLKQGVVLTTMHPQTWIGQIRAMPRAEAITHRISEQLLDLKYLSGESVIDLISAWLKNFYDVNGVIPLNSIYPFTEDELRQLGQDQSTFRKVLQSCKELLAEKLGVQSLSGESRIKSVYEEELAHVMLSLDEQMEDKNAIADALYLGFYSLLGQTIEGVEVRNIETIEAKSADQGYLDFRVVGKDGGRIARIGVAVAQWSGQGVTATLKRLTDYEKFGLTRGCLVRSKSISEKATQAWEHLRKLLIDRKGEWVQFSGEHIVPLLAISSVYDRQEDYGLSDEQIFQFIEQENLARDNFLIREILSKPTGRIPKNVTNDDLPITVLDSLSYQATSSNSADDLFSASDSGWINQITVLGDRSLEEESSRKSNYQAGTDFENIVRRALQFLGFTVDNAYRGGAGGLDLFCSKPFPLIGECKAGKRIPSGTTEELIKLGGMHVGVEQFSSATKLIIGAGSPTPDVLIAAEQWKISIISAKSLQKLVEVQAKYSGSIDLFDLKEYLLPGQIDHKIDEFIREKPLKQIKLRANLLVFISNYLDTQQEECASTESIFKAYSEAHPDQNLEDKEFYNILIELSSPLAGYLRRNRQDYWWHDRFYFLRPLVVEL